MRSSLILLASLIILAACSPAAQSTLVPSSTPVPPTMTSLPPTETVIPPTATPESQYERLSPTAIRIKDAVVTADAVISPEKFELTFHMSIPGSSPEKIDPAVTDIKFRFPEGPDLVLEPSHGGGGGGGGDPQGYDTGSAMQGYTVNPPLVSGQLIHLIAYATFNPSTGVTEPVPFEFYLLVR